MGFQISLFAVLFSLNAWTATKTFKPFAIFDVDDRVELYEAGPMEHDVAQAVAGRISKDHLISNGGGYTIARKNLGAEKCSKIRFAEQQLGPSCTGFLVRSDLLVTAAHCMTQVENCAQYVWAFDYALKGAGDESYKTVLASNVYRCKKLVYRRYKDFGNADYAIIQLDRPVPNRKVLELELSAEKVVLQTPIFLAGFPSGLPLKITGGAKILENDHTLSFETDLDIFQGNSGAPVLDQTTGKVLGVVSQGHDDYTRDKDDPSCKVPRICLPGENCVLTKISRASLMEEDLKSIPPLSEN